jgi:hypothetical protein
MSYGVVIRKYSLKWNTPNKGVLLDPSTGTEYSFMRETYTGGKNWNVDEGDEVSFTIENGKATDVTLYKKHTKGFVAGI